MQVSAGSAGVPPARSTVRVGLQVPQAGPNAEAGFIAAFVRQGLRCGFRCFWVGEHTLMGGFVHRAKSSELFLEPIALLGYIAGLERDVELGTSVLVVPHHNPLVLAKSLTTLAHLTGRRLTVGVGAGWAEEEFTALATPFRRRGRATDEFCEIFARFSRENPEIPWQVGPYSYGGGGFQPLPTPLCELWVGGSSPAARRRAARWATGWQPSVRPSRESLRDSQQEVAAGMAEICALCEQYGRDPAAMTCAVRLRLRLTPQTYRTEVPATFAAYREAGVSDFACELNTRDRDYALEAIERLAESLTLAGLR